MSDISPQREPIGLQAFQQMLGGEVPDPQTLASLLQTLASEACLERALTRLKQTHPRSGKQDPWAEVRTQLEAAVDHSRRVRMSTWQMDPRRRTIRLRLDVQGEACLLHPPALVHALAQALLAAGVPLAMGFEKTPRPMITLGPPLPSGVPGRSEWADLSLREPWALPLSELPARTRPFCTPGLGILEAIDIPNISSPVLELAKTARWIWPCPESRLVNTQARLQAFMDSKTFSIEKTGKVEGQKQVKRVEVRPMVLDARWSEGSLCITTRVAPGEAMNIQKLLAGILDCEPTQLEGLERLSIQLSEDPRLAQADRFETKLHNIYEDAVLLDGGYGVEVHEDDEDEPIVITQRRSNS